LQCLANNKQLDLAWMLYADENNGILPPNENGGTGGGWVEGWEDFTFDNAANTNRQLLADSKLGPFCSRQTGIYKCPADKHPCKEGGADWARVRSSSMNGFLEGYAYSQTDNSTWYPDYYGFNRMTDIVRPTPSDLFVFVDEHPDSINDGWLITGITDPNNWGDMPASYHNRACGFSFADGHAEIHRWLEGSTCLPVAGTVPAPVRPPATRSRDIQWMMAHSSAHH
jgi:prepilin-type processing-associated H-X9-DG protein